jgi:hypothetical protein
MAPTDTSAQEGRGASTPGRRVDAGTLTTLEASYSGLVKAGQDSVRAAWRFGQCIDSFTDMYTLLQLADAMELSTGCLYRYRRLYLAYQRPELALEAAKQLETFNIDTIWQLQNDLHPVPHGRPLRGRHWRSTCRNCGGHDVGREEVDKDGNPVAAGEAPEQMDSEVVTAATEITFKAASST